MARTKQTARKSASGAPSLSKNEAKRLAVARAEATNHEYLSDFQELECVCCLIDGGKLLIQS